MTQYSRTWLPGPVDGDIPYTDQLDRLLGYARNPHYHSEYIATYQFRRIARGLFIERLLDGREMTNTVEAEIRKALAEIMRPCEAWFRAEISALLKPYTPPAVRYPKGKKS